MNNPWTNGQANGMFMSGAAGHMNPAMYNNNLNANQNFDVNQFNLANGGVAASQPPGVAFNQQFNPGSVVPAKRPHDGMSGSPQQSQPQQPPPGSRSQTPSYNPFPGQQQPGQPQFANAPTPYQHLQQPGSNNATPSPTMQSQPFRPPQNQPGQQQPGQQPGQPRMNTASPSPFPQHQQPNFTNQMSPMPQTPTQQNQMQQPAQMQQFAQQYGMANPGMAGPGMAMPGMPSMQMRMGMQQMTPEARAYQMQLMAKQQQQQHMRANGMQPGRTMQGQPGQMAAFPGQQPGAQPGAPMMNGQPGNPAQMAQMQQQQAQQLKRQQFLRSLQQYAQQQGRQFNPSPAIGGKQLDLYILWSIIVQLGGSQMVERGNQWPQVAMRLGFNPAQIPSAPEELKQIFNREIAFFEQVWIQRNKKQDPNRPNAQQQMPGMNPGAAPQQSPMKQSPAPPNQANQFTQMQPGAPNQPPHPQSTPVQANASLATNGMTTPQQLMGGPGSMAHRRNSSLRKPEPMTPQADPNSIAAASPLLNKQQRPPSVKRESIGPLMKSEEPQSTNYVPLTRPLDTDGGYNIPVLQAIGSTIIGTTATSPAVEDWSYVDIRTLTLSLASGIHSEVRYALDALAVLSNDQRIALNLEFCEELLDALVDCAEEQLEVLEDENAEVSDGIDLPTYEDIIRGGKIESATLQDVPAFGSPEYDMERAAEKVIAITTIARNLSFYEVNHRLLTSPPLIKWLSSAIRMLGTRTLLLRTYYNTQDFYKDVIIFLSNVTQGLELPSKEDALHIMHFLLAFAPQPSVRYSQSPGKLRFTSFNPSIHRYLPPAVDCLAKLLARQEPNRELYRQIFTASPHAAALGAGPDAPLDLLTQAFALAISVLPDRTRSHPANAVHLRIVEARKAYLTQGMLAADILSALAPAHDAALARAWIESEDGWAVALLKLSALLSVDGSQPPPGGLPAVPPNVKGRGAAAAAAAAAAGHDPNHPLGMQDYESFRLITYRALSMLRRLADRVGKAAAANSTSPQAAPPPPQQNSSHRSTSSLANGTANGVSDANGDGHAAATAALAEGEDSTTADVEGVHPHHRPKWDGMPYEHAILGAMTLGHIDKTALGLLHDLHELALQRQ